MCIPLSALYSLGCGLRKIWSTSQTLCRAVQLLALAYQHTLEVFAVAFVQKRWRFLNDSCSQLLANNRKLTLAWRRCRCCCFCHCDRGVLFSFTLCRVSVSVLASGSAVRPCVAWREIFMRHSLEQASLVQSYSGLHLLLESLGCALGRGRSSPMPSKAPLFLLLS